MEKVEAANRLGLAWIEAVNAGDASGATALFTGDGVWETETPPPAGTVLRGRAAMAALVRDRGDQAPRLIVEEVLGLGFRGLVRYREAGVRKLAVVQLRGGLIGNLAVYTKG